MQLNRVNKYSYSPECAEMHILIEMIARGKACFAARGYCAWELILHIPPMLQAVLVQSLGGFSVKKVHNVEYIMGLKCVPAYENRVVISHPHHAIFDNEPLVVIDLV